MAVTLNASNSGTGGLSVTSDATGNLAFQTAGTTAVTVDTSQRVGIGTSSPNANLQVSGGIQVTGTPTIGSTGVGVEIGYGLVNASEGAIQAYNRSGSVWINMAYSALVHKFLANNSEAMRIDSSGSLLINKTSRAADESLGITGKLSSQCVQLVSPTTGGYDQINFRNPNGQVGLIGSSGSSTSYGTSSDYRLKENIAPMTGALAKVAQLKPVTYKWKVDGSDGEGFIAHELAEVCPSAVSGEKDAVDKNGDIQPQGIDTSFLVATLTAAIQELKAINDTQAETITALTARIVALEK
jgi:hypothetical protein